MSDLALAHLVDTVVTGEVCAAGLVGIDSQARQVSECLASEICASARSLDVAASGGTVVVEVLAEGALSDGVAAIGASEVESARVVAGNGNFDSIECACAPVVLASLGPGALASADVEVESLCARLRGVSASGTGVVATARLVTLESVAALGNGSAFGV